jgi:ATP-dependent Lon protease
MSKYNLRSRKQESVVDYSDSVESSESSESSKLSESSESVKSSKSSDKDNVKDSESVKSSKSEDRDLKSIKYPKIIKNTLKDLLNDTAKSSDNSFIVQDDFNIDCGSEADLDSEQKKDYDRILESIRDSKPSTKRILESNLTPSKKQKLMDEYLNVYKDANVAPSDKYNLAARLNKSLKESPSMTKLAAKAERNRLRGLSILSAVPLRERILLSKHNDKHKSIILRKYDAIKKNLESEESQKMINWIEWALSVSDIKSNMNVDLAKLCIEMNKSLYGMDKIKDELIITVINRIGGVSDKRILTLVGPPGVGKTMIVGLLAESLGVKYERICLAGEYDSSVIKGHSFTYLGSQPGQIISNLRKVGSNGIIYIDEVDKISRAGGRSDIEGSLMHILDPSQNFDYHDNYLNEISVDLSNIWFILSANNINDINPVLRDRLHVIEIPGYSFSDKVKIAKNYLIPKYCKKYELAGKVNVSEEVCRHIVSTTPNVPGVRDLERTVDVILNKIFVNNVILNNSNSNHLHANDLNTNLNLPFLIPDFKLPFTLTEKIVQKFIGSPKPMDQGVALMYL